MTSNIKSHAPQQVEVSAQNEKPKFEVNERVRLKKSLRQRGMTFKKSSVGDIADVQISAVSGRVSYTVNFHKAETWALCEPDQLVPHVTRATPPTAPTQPPTVPESVTTENQANSK